ncbi:MAG: hypothetical protein ACKVOH_06855 [Chlamydiales bacterium]
MIWQFFAKIIAEGAIIEHFWKNRCPKNLILSHNAYLNSYKT